MYFAQNLRYLREQRGLSQQELSDALELNQASLVNWETECGTPDIKSAIDLSDFFDVSLDDLLLKCMEPSAPLYVRNLIYLQKKYQTTKSDFSGVFAPEIATEAELANISIKDLIYLADFFDVTLEQLTKQDLTGNGERGEG